MRWVLLACVMLATVGCSHEAVKPPPVTAVTVGVPVAQVHALLKEKDDEIARLKSQIGTGTTGVPMRIDPSVFASPDESAKLFSITVSDGTPDEKAKLHAWASLDGPNGDAKVAQMERNLNNVITRDSTGQALAVKMGVCALASSTDDNTPAHPLDMSCKDFIVSASQMFELGSVVNTYGPPDKMIPDWPQRIEDASYLWQCSDGYVVIKAVDCPYWEIDPDGTEKVSEYPHVAYVAPWEGSTDGGSITIRTKAGGGAPP